MRRCGTHRWDGLVDRYVAACEARGLADATIERRMSELGRFGLWLKTRRPKPKLEEVDPELVVRFIRSRSAFRARATVSGVVSDLRVMGEFLVEEGVWQKNPLRWIKGPKLDPRRNLPKRIGKSELKALWEAAQRRRSEYGRYQMLITIPELCL